jgi:surfactin synthase thioesterase subunit
VELVRDPLLDALLWSKSEGSQLGKRPLTGQRTGKTVPPKAASRTQVFCFPPAGLRAEEFIVPESDGTEVSYTCIEWHGDDGSWLRSMPEMVERARRAVLSQQQPGAATVFYGHCLGAIVAYELSLRLQREGLRLPDNLLVTGVVGPHLYVAPNAHRLPTEKLLELLNVLRYPFADRLRRDRSFLDQRIELIRADLEAMASYEYQPSEPLETPITAVSLRHDLWSYPLRTNTWAAHTAIGFRVEEWEGDHYNSMRQPKRIHELIRSL